MIVISENQEAQVAQRLLGAPEVSIVMPCLNEAETIASCIAEARAALIESEIAGEIVIADNGSDDGSQAIAEKCGARVVAVSEKGYGSAIRGGIAVCRGRYIVIGDADASYNFGHMSRFVSKMREGYDLVMGNRFLGGIEPGAMAPLHKYLGNPVLTGLGRLFFKCPIGDFHCGLRGLSAAAFERMHLVTTGMEFASEMVIKATLQGMRITEIPTTLRRDGRSRAPHLRSWRDGWRHLRFMLLFCPQWLYTVTGSCAFILGVSVVAIISVLGRLPILGAALNINASASCAMLAGLGLQLLISGLFARRFGAAIGTHPQSMVLDRIQSKVSLEHGILFGLVVATAGIVLLVVAFLDWRRSGFGQMDSMMTVRQVIPAVMLITLGMQTIFGSFLMSLISLIPQSSKKRSY